MTDLSDIGPHEGREFDMMRSNQKDVSLFFELKPDGLDNMLKDGFCLLQFPQFVDCGATYFTWIVFRKGFEDSALRLKYLVEQPSDKVSAKKEHEIGRILSYTPRQVDSFLRNITQQPSGSSGHDP